MSAVSPNKRRKLNASSTKAPLSAFAARKAQKSTKDGPDSHKGDLIPLTSHAKVTTRSRDLVGSIVGTHDPTPVESVPLDLRTTSGLNETPLDLEGGQLSSFESRGQSPEVIPVETPSITLSNFKPDKENVRLLSDDSVALHLAPGERLVILGEYEISVRKGQVTLMGATLQSSKASHPVFASSSHALPVVRCSATDIDGADLRLRSCENGLRSLRTLSPLYGRLWNDYCGVLGLEYEHLVGKSKKSSFQILSSSKDGPSRTFLQPLISPPLWNEMLARCSTSTDEKPRIVIVCGPKSSGKSTFAKLLVNRLVSTPAETANITQIARNPGVAILDIDPGQPEYCPPGQLALVHTQEPNFGPPFAHPMSGPKSKILRSHSIGAVSPSLDPELYMACALELFAHYRNLLLTIPNCPLVINTPGWVLGTGLEILMDFITKVRPTEIIYMSKDGPPEVVESLTEASTCAPVLTLPSQASEYTTRTAAHLRTMQYMSYFHLNPRLEKGLTWNTHPLTSMPPWEIRYSGEAPGILGVICYGEQPPASLVADTLNGSLVSIVVINNMTAIPGWDLGESKGLTTSNGTDSNRGVLGVEDFDLGQELQMPLTVQTPEEIPYFNPLNAITLDPSYSHSIGLGLVRGIDIERRRIQILTPISPKVIEEINEAGKSIVLVSGKLDTPGWAYVEELTQKTATEKSKAKLEADAMDTRGEDGEEVDSDVEDIEEQRNLEDGFKDAPWIQKLEGSQGRGVGSRVWRVRRDLGKSDD